MNNYIIGMGSWLWRKGVKKEQRETRKGVDNHRKDLHCLALWPLAAIKDTGEVLMGWRQPVHHSVSHACISYSPPTLNLQSNRRKGNVSLVCLFSWLYQVRSSQRSAGGQMKAQTPARGLTQWPTLRVQCGISLFTEKIQIPRAFSGSILSSWTNRNPSLILNSGQEPQWQAPIVVLILRHCVSHVFGHLYHLSEPEAKKKEHLDSFFFWSLNSSAGAWKCKCMWVCIHRRNKKKHLRWNFKSSVVQYYVMLCRPTLITALVDTAVGWTLPYYVSHSIIFMYSSFMGRWWSIASYTGMLLDKTHFPFLQSTIPQIYSTPQHCFITTHWTVS